MRTIIGHEAPETKHLLDLVAVDEPGHGGANHKYTIKGQGQDHTLSEINFQNGPVQEAGGVNGVTIEALITVGIDRLLGFQSGRYACHENAEALHHLEAARNWLHARTLARVAANVEGTSAPTPTPDAFDKAAKTMGIPSPTKIK